MRLVDVAYSDRLTFRKNVGLLLQKLAGQPEMPLVVGLDIVYRKFEQQPPSAHAATAELIKGVRALTAKGVPVIAGYNPDQPPDYYEKILFGATSPFTDIGPNIVRIRDGIFHAKVSEKIRSDAKRGPDIKFFAVSVVKHGNKLGDEYPGLLEKKYDNILPLRYQKKFTFDTYHFPFIAQNQFTDESPFAGKTVLVGNFKCDYNQEQDFHGLHTIAHATQMLTDQATRLSRLSDEFG